jgi:hypothetical protein
MVPFFENRPLINQPEPTPPCNGIHGPEGSQYQAEVIAVLSWQYPTLPGAVD